MSDSSQKISLRVLEGFQVTNHFFTGNMSIKQLLSMVEFADETLAPHESYQRRLNEGRVKECAAHVLKRTPLSEKQKQLTKWSFPPILLALPSEAGAWEFDGDQLHLAQDAKLPILDGQHRCAALGQIAMQAHEASQLVVADPNDDEGAVAQAAIEYQWGLIEGSQISVMFFNAPTLEEQQAIFGDVNKNQSPVNKSMRLLSGNDSDPIARFCLSVVRGTTKKEKILPFASYEANKSSVRGTEHLFTFAQIYKMIECAWPQTTDLKARGFLRQFLSGLAEAVTPYQKATAYYESETKEEDDEYLITPSYLARMLIAHKPIVTESFGFLGAMIWEHYKAFNHAALVDALSITDWEPDDPLFDPLYHGEKLKNTKANKKAFAEKLFALYQQALKGQTQT